MQEELDTNIINKIEWFPFVRIFFSDSDEWSKLTDAVKMSYAFKLNRLIAIKRPEYMQLLNKAHSPATIDALHNAFKTKGRQPGWTYTKTRPNQTNEELSKYPTFIINDFIRYHGLEQKSFEFVLSVHYDEVIKELDKALAIFNQTPKKSK